MTVHVIKDQDVYSFRWVLVYLEPAYQLLRLVIDQRARVRDSIDSVFAFQCVVTGSFPNESETSSAPIVRWKVVT